MGFETPEEGYLAKILIQAGTKDVIIGKLVCIIVENESDLAAFKDFKDDGESTVPISYFYNIPTHDQVLLLQPPLHHLPLPQPLQ